MRIFIVLLGVVALSACQSIAQQGGEARYTLEQGKAWRGVKVGNAPVRSASVICYRSECYRLLQLTNLPGELNDKYQLNHLVNYQTLSQAPGIERDGERLVLPKDIGWQLFVGARTRDRLEKSEAGVSWRP
ncbi:hypothetical protein [Motiliproteus sp.]|uniref:hypothetical protein n=1 Tax=Motiliproteus sp. TaxID=1898955 RepID=UPI003BA87310